MRLHNKILGLIAGIAVLAAVAVPVYATKGSGKGHHGHGGGVTASIVLDQADPHLGDIVTFTTTGGVMIALYCNQGLGNDVFYVSQPVGTPFLLGGTASPWLTTGGGATCYADLDRAAEVIFFAGGAR